MAQSEEKVVVVEIPESLVKLSRAEAERLKQVFRTEVLNTVSAKEAGTLLSITIQNTKHTPTASVSSGKAGGKAGSRGAAKGAKKSARKSTK